MPKGIKGFQKGHPTYDGVEKGWFKKGQRGPWAGKKRPDISKMFKGREVSKGTKIKISNTLKKNPVKYWLGKKRPDFAKLNRDPDFIKKKMKALIEKPNKLEKKMISIIERHNLPYKYVGNGDFILGRRCPDFLNCDGKKQVIEIFGRYWHDTSLNPNVRLSRTYDKTIEHYKKYGFGCLILWEDDLKKLSEQEIVKKIDNLMGGDEL